MEKDKDKNTEEKEAPMEFPPKDHPQKYHAPEARTALDNPVRSLPAYNPPVPNRAWTDMRYDIGASNVINDFSDLTPEEKADLYMHPKKY